jgi:thiamine biosynthesis lipoprotein
MPFMKKPIILFLTLLIIITLSACAEEDQITFDLTSDGFIAEDQGEDISDFVEITNNVDATTAGTYTVEYNLTYKNINELLTREVTVEYPSSNCYYIVEANEFQCQKIWSSYLHTIVKLSVFYNSEQQQDSAEIFNHIEDILTTYNDLSDKYANYDGVTNIKTINDNPTVTHEIDQKLFDLITFSLAHQEEVNNLFNIALGPVLQIWSSYRDDCNISGICQVPSIEELNAQNLYTNPNDISLDEEALTITLKENMALDVGGVSKGYISRVITEYLDSLSLEAYLLNNGESNVSIGGIHPTRDSGAFLIGITNPDYNPFIDEVSYFAAVKLMDGDQLVTSGDYQQYYTVGDEVYHHIIHPETLYPERYMRSVSIIYNDAALGDLYSTAIFLMPIDEGIEFVNGIDGLEAIWYDLDGNIFYSEQFEELYLYDLFN